MQQQHTLKSGGLRQHKEMAAGDGSLYTTAAFDATYTWEVCLLMVISLSWRRGSHWERLSPW